MFSDSLDRQLGDVYSAGHRRALRDQGLGYDVALWQALGEQGILGLIFPARFGGFDGSAMDTMVVSIEFGRHLSYEPFLSTIITGGNAVCLAGSDAQKEDILPKVIAGELTLATAFGEPDTRFDLADIAMRATKDGDGYVLSGTKSGVLGGDQADLLIVSARTSGEDRFAKDGITLFLVDASASGVERTAYRQVDGRAAAEISFDAVRVSPSAMLGPLGGAYPLIEHICDLGAAAICAEALGAIEKINDLTLDYLKSRQQFGQAIGNFQVLQHYMADMLIEYEHAKSLVYEVGMKADSTDARDRQKAVSAAKVFIAEKGRVICEKAMQMHGGIGITDEYELGEYVKRVMAAEFAFGDVDHHIARYAAGFADELT